MAYFTKILVLFFISIPVSGAPLPGTTTSEFMKPNIGVFKSKFGFEIRANKTSWLQIAPPKKSRFIETVFRSPELKNNTRGTLTVRVDRLKKKVKLQKYVKRWIKEYPKYGYEVLGSKKFKSGDKKGYVIDLVNNGKKRQLRQVIYLKKQMAVLLTCRDHIDSFRSSLQNCNGIVKGFSWKKRKSKKM